MCRGVDGDDDGFGGGSVALVGDTIDGDEHVGFRKVGGDAGAGNRVGDDDKVCGQSCLTFVMADDVHYVAFGEIAFLHIQLVHEHDPPSRFDATVPVIQSINGGVVLIVTPDGHHKQLIRCQVNVRHGMNGESCFPR